MPEAQAVTIEVPDDDIAGIVDTNEAGAVKKVAAVDPGDAGISDLRAQMDRLTRETEDSKRREREANAAREETERRARDEVARSREDAAKARGEAAGVSKAAIKSAIDGTAATIANAKTAIQAAWEAGDFAKASELNEQMAAAAARKARLEADLDALPDPATTAGTERTERTERTEQPQPGDPLERYLSQFTPKSASWIREHPECATNRKLNLQMLAAHEEAMEQKFKADTAEYFQFIEKQLGFREDEIPEPGETNLRAIRDTTRREPARQQQQQPRKTPMTSAPVTRGDGPTDGGRTSVTLTPGEVSNATDGTIVWNYDDKGGRFKKGDPIGVDEMARRKRALTKEGRYMQAEA